MFAQLLSLLPVSLIYDHSIMNILSMMENRSFPDSNIDLNVFLLFLLLSFAITLWALRGCIIRFHKKRIVESLPEEKNGIGVEYDLVFFHGQLYLFFYK